MVFFANKRPGLLESLDEKAVNGGESLVAWWGFCPARFAVRTPVRPPAPHLPLKPLHEIINSDTASC